MVRYGAERVLPSVNSRSGEGSPKASQRGGANKRTSERTNRGVRVCSCSFVFGFVRCVRFVRFCSVCSDLFGVFGLFGSVRFCSHPRSFVRSFGCSLFSVLCTLYSVLCTLYSKKLTANG